MQTELIILVTLIVIIVCAVYWYLRRAKSANSSSSGSGATKVKALPETDPYLQKVASDKADIDMAVITAVQQYEDELEQRFANDAQYVKLMEQLSQFARVNELDEALITLWEEIKNYPEWSSQEDLDKWNKLNLTGISGTNEKDISSVEFMRGTQQFRISRLIQSGVEEPIVGLSLFEDDNEVFAIDCLITSSDEEAKHICQRINTFKKRGNWASVLLEYYGQIKIEKENSLNDVKYFCAAEIKSHFE